MKRERMLKISVICVILFGAAIISACAENQHGPAEPDITVEYLSGEYAVQLTRDGALVSLGVINIETDEEGVTWINVSEREYVEDAGEPNGFYIADKNLEADYQLSPEARATFLPGGSSIALVLDANEFVSAAAADLEEFGAGNPGYKEHKLYHVYAMDDQIMLLLAQYIP